MDAVLDIEQDENEEKIRSNLDEYGSLSDFRQANFPSFLTVQKLFGLIDCAMDRPFFRRDGASRLIGASRTRVGITRRKAST